MKSIGILETGVTPASLLPRFGRYDAMVARMFGPAYRFETFDVQAGRLPADPGRCDVYVVTGSSAGVYDALPWIEPLKGFLRLAQGRARLVGLCFGHQVMAEAFGGRVEKSPKGWGLGLHRYTLEARMPWMDDGGAARPGIAVAASHQDQVVAPPPGATVLAGSAFTPIGMLGYAGGEAVSLQLHPEFEADFAAALVSLRRPHLADPGAADAALASLAGPSDAPRVARWLRAFVDGGAAAPAGP